MITKERLEELIEQGALIFYILNNSVALLRLNNSYGISVEEYNKEHNCKPQFYHSGYVYQDICDADKIFETEEDARWELEMTATYEDKLKLANYTDFENENGDRVFYHKGTTYELSLWWASDNTKIIRITWKCRDGFGWLFEEPLTKENYIEACKLCLRLFKGEEV